jgi:type IV conjugative transfer system coupling protein TraD
MSKKSHPDHFIRGGQTMQHWLRMASQVLKGGTAFAALVFFLSYAGLCLNYYRLDQMHLTWAHWMAGFAVENRGEPDRMINYKDPDEGWIERSAEDLYLDQRAIDVSADYNQKAIRFAWWSGIPAGAAFFLVFGIFYISGRRLEGDEHVRGTQLITTKELIKWSDRKWQAYRKKFGRDFKTGPQYTVAGIKFPPNAVEAQTAICGTVGTGKSNAFKELLTTVRESGGRAVIYDRMGSFVRDFYDPSRDVVLNPFDARSRCWSPFFEADSPEFFTQMADVLIPDRQGGGDQFWTQSARIVFDYAAQKIYQSGKWSNKALRDAILNIPAEELSALIEGTPGRHFFNEDIKKTSGSIRANLIAELRFLEFLRDDGEPFSIRDWIKNDGGGFIFLTGDAEHAAATRNLISTVLEVGANALMTCEESNDPRVWFMIDEVATLNRMPFLPKSLAEIRQFGGAFVIGYQVYSQLEDIYGPSAAKTISGNLNNRIVFNTPDADTAELYSKSLGSEDVEERRESITVGAHETRDGVGFMSQRTERRIVTASQIQSLPQFEGYIRFAYDAPTAFVRFKAFDTTGTAQKFIPYRGVGLAIGAMEVRSVNDIIEAGEAYETVPFRLLPLERQRTEFDAWQRRQAANGPAHMSIEERNVELDWWYFSHRRHDGSASDKIGPTPIFMCKMADGSGYEIPRDFDPGPCPTLPKNSAAEEEQPQLAAVSAPTTKRDLGHETPVLDKPELDSGSSQNHEVIDIEPDVPERETTSIVQWRSLKLQAEADAAPDRP